MTNVRNKRMSAIIAMLICIVMVLMPVLGLTSCDSAPGPQGEQGIQGVQGEKGDTGAQGPQGDKGDTGATGAQGPQGEKGDAGNGIVSVEKTDTKDRVDIYTITFADGSTTTFEVSNGLDGAQGPAGEKGDKGDTGAQGPAGEKGDKGDTSRGISKIEYVDGYLIVYYTDGTQDQLGPIISGDPTTPPEDEPTTPPEDEPEDQKNIALTAYLLPMSNPTQRNHIYQLCKDADIDYLSHLYVKQPWVAEDHTFEWYKEVMAEADRYGLKVLTRDYDVQTSVNMTDEEIRALAEKYKDLPGFGGFYVVDEPYNPTPYARVANILLDVCPTANINVNFFPYNVYPSEDTYLRQLCDYGGLVTEGGKLSLDCYCFSLDGSVNEIGLFRNYELLHEAGLLTDKDTAVYVQSVGNNHGYRRPSEGDLRYNMTAALAYGVKEIKFFTWAPPAKEEADYYTEAILDFNYNPTALYYSVCDINKKIHALGTHLAVCDATEVYHSINKTPGAYNILPDDYFVQVGSADVILSMMEERDGNGEYVFVVNKDFSAEQIVTLTLDGITTVYLVDDETGELTETALQNGSLTMTLAAGDGALIKLPEGDFINPEAEENQNLALHAPVFGTSSVGSENYYLYNLTDGIVDSDNAARVSSKTGVPQLLTVDLGKITSINRIDLYHAGIGILCGAFSPVEFDLLVSEDGENWKTVHTNTDPLSRAVVAVFRFEDTDARYVRICVKNLKGGSSFADIGELAVYSDDGSIPDEIPTVYIEEIITEGQNLALNKPVVDYSSYSNHPEWGCHYSFINDGNYNQAWASDLYRNASPDSVEFITIDLLGIYDINRVIMVPRAMWNGTNVYPEEYEIQVSIDGVNFTTVKSVVDDLGTTSVENRVLDFDTTPARYIRFYATRLTYSSSAGCGYAIEMSEMEVFGSVHNAG